MVNGAHITTHFAIWRSLVILNIARLYQYLLMTSASYSALAEAATTRADALDGSSELKAAIAIQKTFDKTRRKIGRLKVGQELQ